MAREGGKTYLSFAENYVVRFTELQLEREINPSEETREALRLIDANRSNYDRYRSHLTDVYNQEEAEYELANPTRQRRLLENSRFLNSYLQRPEIRAGLDGFEYLARGKESPDPIERMLFENAKRWLDELPEKYQALPALYPILALIRKPRRKAPPKKHLPKLSDHEVLIQFHGEISDAIANRKSKTEALRSAVDMIRKSERHCQREATEKRLGEWWDWRTSLR